MEAIQEFKLYSEIVNIINPLDLIAFRGSDRLSSNFKVIPDGIDSNIFTHVGIVITSDIFPTLEQLEFDRYYVWECLMSVQYSNSGRNIPGKIKFGVQIRDLEDVIASYENEEVSGIALCTLKENPYEIGDRDQIIETLAYVHEEYIRIYELNYRQMCDSVYCSVFRNNFEQRTVRNQKLITNFNRKEHEWYFCSEMVGLIYKDLGVLPSDIDVKDVTPSYLLGYDQEYNINIIDKVIQLYSSYKYKRKK